MTRAFAEVIGDPIAHSKSALIHNFWLGKLGIDAEYRCNRVLAGGLADYLYGAHADPHWRGCNVTIPHKIAIMDMVNDTTGIKVTIGAMNTIVRSGDGSLWGTNSDVAGFLEPTARRDWRGRSAIVVGAGGAAKAVLFALKSVGIGEITILNRSVDKAAALLANLGFEGQAISIDAPLPAADLLVNASALGMTGQPPLLLDLSRLGANSLVYDLVYAPLRTSLLVQAEARGMATIDGLYMLVGQAAVAFALFFGAPAPREHDDELRALLTA